MRRKRREQFGYVRRLPSGRFQAFYIAPDGSRHNAPTTFLCETDAGTFLTAHRRPDHRSASGSRRRRAIKATVSRVRRDLAGRLAPSTDDPADEPIGARSSHSPGAR